MARNSLRTLALFVALLMVPPALAGGGGRGGRGGPGGFDPNGGPGSFDPNGGPGGPGGGGPGGPGGGRGGRGGGGGGPGGGFSVLGSTQNLVAGLQEPLTASSEEWKIIAPVLARVVAGVQALNPVTADDPNDRAAPNGGPGGGGPGGGGPGGGGGRGGRGGGGGGNDTFNGPSALATGGRGGPGGGRGGPGGGGPGGPGGPGGGGPNPNADTPAPPAPASVTVDPTPVPAASVNLVPSAPVAANVPAPTSAGTVTLPQAMADLQAALAAPDTTDAQLKQRLVIVRDSRHKTKAAVEAARTELLLLLTTDQEATLVSMGYLN